MLGIAVHKVMRVGIAGTLAYFVLALLVAALIGVLSAKPAHAATFTVNSTGDEADKVPGDGVCQITTADQCTLRAAIEESNLFPGADTIAFNIPGSGVQTLSPGDGLLTTRGQELPTITTRVTIDGYTQPGAKENTLTQPDRTNAELKIELHGANAENYCYGLNVDANNVVIRGLVINNFEHCGASNASSAPGISLSGTGNTIQGNFIGTNASGTAIDRNARGVSLSDVDDSTIGGTSAAARNLISGNVHSGVEVFSGSGNTIRGNLIGPDKNGDPLGDPLGDSNAVSGGVVIRSGTGNRILSNSIFSNGDTDPIDGEELGIDLSNNLGANGVTDNDPKDPDTGANRLQNYPVITSAQTFGNFTSINARLNSTPSTRDRTRTFIIQFFSSPSKDSSGFGEGKTFLGQTQVTTNGQGNTGLFGFAPFQKVPVGQFITATATRKDTGDTSEFSKARVVEEPGIGGG
jgi:trimeric autotransporter adhesin